MYNYIYLFKYLYHYICSFRIYIIILFVKLIFHVDFTGFEERDYLMWSYFNNGRWDYLEMFMLLSEEITDFDFEEEDEIEYPDLLVSLVIARCPVR